MAYRFDQKDNAIVIDGFEAGIADSPFNGISDERNVNIISVPGEASVNFATAALSTTTITGTIISADSGTNYITLSSTAGLTGNEAIVFAGGALPSGLVAGTTYWVGNVNGAGSNTMKAYTDYEVTGVQAIAGTGTGTFSTYTVNQPKYFTRDTINGKSYMVDSIGQVWSDKKVTPTNSYWTYTGNKVPTANSYTHGNGIGFYAASPTVGYVFVFHDQSVDYTAVGTISWQYQWNPATGIVGVYSATPSKVLKNSAGTPANHECIVGTDNRFYYTDTNYVGRFYQTDPATVFVTTTTSTYTFDNTAVLPVSDFGNCIAQLGTNMLIGSATKNLVYPWDRFSFTNNNPIFLSESLVSKIVTVNTNSFIFAGNRGRIYVTNGSQATLFKKVPDHISGTVEPYFTWGGATTMKDQVFFSFSATTNGGSANSQYGGIWAVDATTGALRLTNKLSYDTYSGYSTAMMAVPISGALGSPSNPAGTGLLAGWYNGSTYGIDGSSGSPYTGSQATIDSDLIPIGTYQMPRNFTQVEYRLTKPLVSGESVTIQYRLDFSQSYTTILSDSTVGNFSSVGSVNFSNAQWLQLRVVLNSTASSPSYTRLKEIRIR